MTCHYCSDAATTIAGGRDVCDDCRKGYQRIARERAAWARQQVAIARQRAAKPRGHSSSVAGWLIAGGNRYELAQVGPGFCKLQRRSKEIKPNSTAEIVIEIDGERFSRSVKLAMETDSRTINFEPLAIEANR